MMTLVLFVGLIANVCFCVHFINAGEYYSAFKMMLLGVLLFVVLLAWSAVRRESAVIEIRHR